MNTLLLTDKEEYSIIQLNRGRANVINQEMVDELRTTLEQLKSTSSCRGLILTGQPNFFSAGLDLIELYSYDRDKLGHFLKSFGRLYLDLVTFPKPMIASITGHAPAGGTVMAIAADYRIMANEEKFTMGLNEVAVNIKITKDLIKGYSFWIGTGLASKFVMEGKLLKASEALACNLVDEIIEGDKVLERAEQKMRRYLIADDEILQYAKQELRRDWISSLNQDPGEAFEQSLSTWFRPEIRSRLKMLVDQLQRK